MPNNVTPYAASIKLTENCNSRCITCNYWKRKSVDKISTDKAIDIIRQLEDMDICRLRFTGGETLLRSDFFDILKAIEKNRFSKVTLATNGILISKYAENINNSCLTDLGISIDGLEETNDRIRGIKGHYKLVFESLKRIVGKRITIMTTLNHRSHLELQAIIDLCSERGYLWDFNLLDDRIYFLKNSDIQSIWPEPNAVDQIIRVIKQNRNRRCLSRINDLQLNYARNYLKKIPLKEPPCFMGFMEIFINSQGDVFPGCYFFPPAGNVLESSLLEIIRGDTYRNRIDLMIKRKCRGCTCGYGVNEIINNLPLFAIYEGMKRLRLYETQGADGKRTDQ